jgi:phage head maturation protease
MPEENEPLYRYITVKERESIPLEDFAWPDAPDRPEYPCDTQEHLNSCAKLLGKAPDDKQASIKARAKRIAKRHGFTLPKSWQEEKDDKMNKTDTPDILRADLLPKHPVLYVPIERIDKKKREVFGRATVEDVDAYKTIFSYEGSKRAFSKWMREFGNVREMHDGTRAIGKAVQVQFDDENKQVLVRAFVSRSADGDNAWTKIEEGILTGFSVGASNGVWTKVERNDKEYPYLQDYDLVELSIVDHPATPGCTIEVARADGFISDIIEPEDEPEETPQAADETRNDTPDITREGARICHATQGDLHSLRDSHFQNAKKTMVICGCDECKGGMAKFDPDGDGDIDLMPSLDWDGDGGAGGDGSGNGMALSMSIQAELTRQLTPIITRFNGIGARLSQVNTSQQNPDITRRLETIESKIAELDEVRSLLSEVKGLVVKIAEQPQGGGPIVNSSLVKSQLAEQQAQQPNQQAHAQVIGDLARAGILTREQQINAALSLFGQGR